MYTFKRLLVELKSYYALDVRALAIMRIGVALVILCDLIIRAQDLTAFFTNEGILPTHLLPNFGWQPGFWSIHTLSGNYSFIVFVFIIHFIAAIALLLGYKTQLATLFVWLLTISLHNRNLFILQSGDDLLRLTLFWAMFIPWGNAYSIDSKKYQTKQTYFSFAILGYLFLIVSVYFFTVFFKNSTEWQSNGSAIYFALSLDQIRLALGDWLYQYPSLMKYLTHFVYIIEILIPILILLPTKKNRGKLIAFGLLLILHIGIGLTIYVGLFYIINITTALALIPGSVINKLKLPAICNNNKTKKTSHLKLKYIQSFFSIAVIIICLILNLSYMHWFNYELNTGFNKIVNVLRLNQYWGMFSPHIMKEDGWYVYEGYTQNGKHWDLKENQPIISTQKPQHIVKDYSSDRWRKLAENMQRNDYTFLRPLYCKYYLKQWNINHPENPMKSLDFIFFKEISDTNYSVKPIERQQFCFCITND